MEELKHYNDVTMLNIALLIYVGFVIIGFIDLYLTWIQDDKTGKYLRNLFDYHGAFISILVFVPLINIVFAINLIFELVLFISKYIRIRL